MLVCITKPNSCFHFVCELVPGHNTASDIIVKVLNKKVGGGNYYKKKGTVVKVEQKYIGHVKMSDSGHVLKVDQVRALTSLHVVNSG